MVEAEMAPAPEMWHKLEPAGRPEPILELPLGDGDYGSTLRASIHRRKVLNGVSGYDPPHYFALKDALDRRNPAILSAIASLGGFDIVVDSEQDVDGSALRFAAAAPGAALIAQDGMRTLFRVPQSPAEPARGHPWPIRAVDTAHHRENRSLMLDGDPATGWADLPDQPDAWVIADLGEVRTVGGLTEMVGDYPRDFPRHLVIEVSMDGRTWERAWEGPTDAHAFLAFVREPRQATLTFRFAARQGPTPGCAKRSVRRTGASRNCRSLRQRNMRRTPHINNSARRYCLALSISSVPIRPSNERAEHGCRHVRSACCSRHAPAQSGIRHNVEE
jgi:hypothetical protein